MQVDMPVRWNSTNTMLKRYNEVKECAHTVLHEFGKSEKCLSEDEVQLVQELITCLQLFETLSTYLGSRDMTLANADKLLNKFLEFLQEEAEKSSIAQKLYSALHERILERRNQDLLASRGFRRNFRFINNGNIGRLWLSGSVVWCQGVVLPNL